MIISIQAANGRAIVRGKLFRVFNCQLVCNAERDINQTGERIVLAQPRDSHDIRQLAPLAQLVFDEADQMRFSATARTNQQNVVLVAG